MGKLAELAGTVEPEDIDNGETLSQYGRLDGDASPFRSWPRAGVDTTGLSMTRGLQAAADLAKIVCGRSPRESDLVRYTLAGTLRQAGFVVTHDPKINNPDHVLVTIPGNSQPWNDEWIEKFEASFEITGR